MWYKNLFYGSNYLINIFCFCVCCIVISIPYKISFIKYQTNVTKKNIKQKWT